MTEFYNKQQVDALATIIGERVHAYVQANKGSGGTVIEPATGIGSFLDALDGKVPSADPTQYLNVTMVNPVYTPTSSDPIILS